MTYGREENAKKIYNNIQYNKSLSTTAQESICWGIAQSINSNNLIKSTLMRGKHEIKLDIYNHYISFETNKVYLQPLL